MHTASAVEVRFAGFGAGYIVNKGNPSAAQRAARNADLFGTCWHLFSNRLTAFSLRKGNLNRWPQT